MTAYSIREHTTSTIQMQLLADDIGIDLSSIHHLQLNMVDSLGQTYTYSTLDSPTTAITVKTPLTGIVQFMPPTAQTLQYVRSPYKFFWWVYNTATEKYAVPSNGNSLLVLEKDF
jgi:hypothetical protein